MHTSKRVIACHQRSSFSAPYPVAVHEYIVGVESREGEWTDAVELVTSTGRPFRAGGSGGHAL